MEENLLRNEQSDNCAIIIQARMSSKRFPGKMMSFLCGIPLIEFVYKRCKKSHLTKVLVATSCHKTDDILYNYCLEKQIPTIRGSLSNVLNRYIKAAESLKVDYIVRVCGDTPFVDIFMINSMLDKLINKKLEYISFDRKRCIPGFLFEMVTLSALKKVAQLTRVKEDLEHVTKYIIDNKEKFLISLIESKPKFSPANNIRITIDYPEDIIIANSIVSRLKDKFSFSCADILNITSKLKASKLH